VSGVEFLQSDTDRAGGKAGVRTSRLPWFATGLSLPLLSVAFMVPDAGYQDSLRLDRALVEIQPVFTLPLLFNSTDLVTAGSFGNPDGGTDGSNSVSLKVHRGDTLDRLFRSAGLDLAQLQAIMKLDPARENLRLLKPGDQIDVRHAEGSILEVTRRIDAFNKLNVTRTNDGFDAQVVTLDYETRSARTTGEIRSSLFEAAARSGVSDTTIMKLASIFASDIDFMLDLRTGDHFTLIYDEMWHQGEKLGEGEVLAAEFVNQGKAYRAVRYEASDGRIGYYTPEGKSLRKSWVRAPLTFSRVSSDFNPRRRHPILNTIRAHTGVDYAAPAGTPVRAPADGKVSFRGRKGGYGNAIIMQHAGGITTLYGHLSRFAKSALAGRRVSQGEVIGYVGATGLATAPHLHYEYRVNGRYMNPRTVKLPNTGPPLHPSEQARFARAAAPLLQRLNTSASMLASDKKPAAGGSRS